MITTDSHHLALVLADVVKERARQDAKFGDQVNIPDVMPHATSPEQAARLYGIPHEAAAKQACEAAKDRNACTWLDVLVEEVAETLAPAVAGDLVSLRAEVTQCAAVCCKWIQAIDRRIAAG